MTDENPPSEPAGAMSDSTTGTDGKPSRLRRLFKSILSVLGALFGTYSPPGWMRFLFGLVADAALVVGRSPVGKATGFVARRWKLALGVGAVLALVVGGLALYDEWERSRPGPPWISLSVGEPGPTPLDGKNRFQPLTVNLTGSGAPLDLVGKSLDEAALASIKLEPAVAGEWTWVDDRSLRFDPLEDWPIDQELSLTFLPTAFSDQVRVEKLAFTFRTARFEARLKSASFYEDPTAKKQKKLVATVSFSHLVDRSSFEKHLSLLQIEPRPGAIPDIETPVGFSVRYAEHGDEAYIHSDLLAVPADDQELKLTLRGGVVAERGGRATDADQTRSITVPGVYSYFKLQNAEARWVNDENDQARLVLLVSLTDGVTEADLEKHIELFVLPQDRPAQEGKKIQRHYGWGNADEVSPADLAAGTAIVKPDADPPAEKTLRRASFALDVKPDRTLFVRLKKGLTSEGGYELPADAERVVRVPDLSIRLDIAHEGGVLALSGERALALVSRGLRRVSVDLARVIPSEVNHLVSQTRGDMHELSFTGGQYGYDEGYEGEGYEGEGYEGEGYEGDEGEGYEGGEEGEEIEHGYDPGADRVQRGVRSAFGEQNITDPFSFDRAVALTDAASPQYTSLDLTDYLRVGGSLKAGLFFVRLRGEAPDGRTLQRQRFLLVTDLGMLTKQSVDGAWDVFVQSLSTGQPVDGARVEVLGLNGRALVSDTTGSDGHVHFKSLLGVGAHQPIAFVVKEGGDLSFMPLLRAERRVNLSRFPVGGVRTHASGDELTAFVFSDRGIYRPGETLQFATIARSRQLSRDVSGLMVKARLHDAKGRLLVDEVQQLAPGGLFTFAAPTTLGSPTGTYTAEVLLLERRASGDLIEKRTLGSASARVEEFVPDTMKIKARLSAQKRDGWVKPEGMSATVTLENLFGAPATDRQVSGRVVVTPVSPWFPGFQGFTFQTVADQWTRHTFNTPLGSSTTGADGEASFDLDLSGASSGLWRVTFDAEGFEAGEGRSVSTSVSTLVSPLEVVLGTKPDGDLDYLKRQSERNVTFIAVDSSLKQVKKSELALVVEEEQYVSVLTERRDGTLAYQSERRLVEVKRQPFSIPEAGEKLRLDTEKPGTFLVNVREGDDVLVSFSYSVAGRANLSRQMEKTAELKLKLERDDYEAGDVIEMSIGAPYTGAGLITIEGDEVYAHRWFEADTTSVVERIEVPEGITGNAYVHVSMLRGADSREVFTRPFSTAVAPFAVARKAQTVALTVEQPARVRPGDELVITVKADQPTRAVLFGADEGILQVARYKTPSPTAHFFKKRALQVSTWQMLDLLMPEASLSQEVSASGGSDDEMAEALAGNLNPFQRKVRAPVAFFSGVLELSDTPTTYRFRVPDDWTGGLKVMAVASSRRAVGSADATVKVRGDIVLTPSAPLFATPGDTFRITVAVSNQIEGSGEAPTDIVVEAKPSSHLTLLGPTTVTVPVAERREGRAQFEVKVNDVLGGAELAFTAQARKLPAGVKAEEGRGTSTLSVRPAAPYLTTLRMGHVVKGTAPIELDRELYPHLATREIQLGSVPIAVARGLYRYVDTFPYGCTEQLISKSVAGMALHDVEGIGVDRGAAQRSFQAAMDALRFRQTDSGAFGMWAANATMRPHHTVYGAHFLLDAKERGWAIDQNVLDRALRYLASFVKNEAKTLEDARLMAYALYVLARSGQVVTKDLDGLRAHVDAAWPDTPRHDLFAVWSAATYALVKKDAAARKLLGAPQLGHGDKQAYYFTDTLARDMQLLYVLARHFPDQLDGLMTPEGLTTLLGPLGRNQYNTLSSAYSILALRAYVDAMGGAGDAKSRRVVVPAGALALSGLAVEGQPAVSLREVLQKRPEKKTRDLPIGPGLFPTMKYGEGAKALELTSRQESPLFYQVTHGGFDRAAPTVAIKDQIEIVREIKKDGEPVTSVEVGDEVVVHIKVRLVGGGRHASDVALVDLLPAGFAVADMEAARTSLPTQGTQSLSPDFVDVREDRMLVFTSLSSTVRSYAYAVKATAPGRMVVPPAQAMSMYNLSLRGRGVSSSIEVKAK